MAYYRNRYRYRYTAPASTEPRSTTCTDKQHDLIVRLVAQIGEAMQTATPESVANAQQQVARLTNLPRLLSEAWGEVSKYDTSHVIDTLIAIQRTTVAVPSTAPQYPGLPAHQRVMVTRFGNKCKGCGAVTVAGTDLAVQVAGAWSAWCLKCANTDPADRIAAQQAEADAAAEARRLINEWTKMAFDAVGMSSLANPRLGLAVDGLSQATDFFRLRRGGLRRVIGGRQDTPIAREQWEQIIERVGRTPDEVRAAAYRFGRELGECCRCGRHLTDEVSRHAGIGPDCASRV